MLKVNPLPASLLMFSMVGIIIASVIGFWPDTTDLTGMSVEKIQEYKENQKFKRDIAIASNIVLGIMFISSVLAATYAPIEEEVEMEKRSQLDPVIK